MSYCTKEDVNSMFGDIITDEVGDEIFATAIDNSTSWIEANLKRNYIPIPTTKPNVLKTVAIYHSASDIYLSLSQGNEDFMLQYDTWFNKAQSLLQDYIDAYNHSEAEPSDLVEHQQVKHSKSMTYNQRRGRGRRWVR